MGSFTRTVIQLPAGTVSARGGASFRERTCGAGSRGSAASCGGASVDGANLRHPPDGGGLAAPRSCPNTRRATPKAEGAREDKSNFLFCDFICFTHLHRFRVAHQSA